MLSAADRKGNTSSVQYKRRVDSTEKWGCKDCGGAAIQTLKVGPADLDW